MKNMTEGQLNITTGKADNELVKMKSFFEVNRNLFARFARGDGIEIVSAQEAGVADQVKTAGIDLKNRKMYFNEEFLNQLNPAEQSFVGLHEYGHFKKLLELLDMPNGYNLYKSWHREISDKKRYGAMDNLLSDSGINKDVIRYAPVTKPVENDLYRKHLFEIKDGSDVLDMTGAPKHIQFAQVFPYEKSGTNRKALIDEDVRLEIDRLKGIKSSNGVSLYDYLVSASIPEDMRIKLQRKYLYPVVDKFFEEDVENKQEQQKQGSESQQNEQQGDEISDNDVAENINGNGEPVGEENGGSQEPKGAGNESSDLNNPEGLFKEYYDKLNKSQPHIIKPEDVDEVVVQYQESKNAEAGKSDQQILDETTAKNEGVSVRDLQKYRNFWQQIERIKNLETQEFVVEELREMFKRIVNDRKKKRYVPKYPVKEGELLVFPAEAVVAVNSGEQEPDVWESIESKERPKEMYGDFDVTVVADRSGSIEKEGLILDQKKAVMLILEALTEFQLLLDDDRSNLEHNLNIRTEAWSFGDSQQVEELKPLSEELTLKQKVNVFNKIDEANGRSTNDFEALEKIRDSISEEGLEKIKNGKMKKIIIITSDGGTSGEDRLQNVLKDLREKGIIVVAIGITKSGKPVEIQYAPDGKVCEDPTRLAVVLADVLKEHLAEL